MKKTISILLAFALFFSCFSNVSFALEMLEGDASDELVLTEDDETIVNLRMGESVTVTLDGDIEVDNPKLDGLDRNIAEGEVVAGKKLYPYSAAKLATAVTNFNGEEVDLEDCLFTFTVGSSSNSYVISHTKEDGSVIYLSHNTDTKGAGYPTNTTSSVVTVEYANDMFALKNNGSYLFFWKNDNTKLHFDKQTGLDGASNYRTYFDLYTPSEDAPEDSMIMGYTKITGLNQIVSGKEYLIVAKANNGNNYLLYPTADDSAVYNYVAQVVNYQIPTYPMVQLATAEQNFNVEELQKITSCLFTFNSTGETNKYNISSTTADGTEVYLSHRNNASGIPCSTNSAVITVGSNNNYPQAYSLLDNTSGTGGGYLYFHKANSLRFNKNSGADSNCYFELYTPSLTAPEDSAVKGFAKVASAEDIVDGNQYLIANTDSNGNYYFLYPYNGGNTYNHVAKLTDTLLKEDEAYRDTEIIFTGVQEGETSVTVNGITYNIIVRNEERNITLRMGESTFIAGTLQKADENQSVVVLEEKAKAPYSRIGEVTDGKYLLGISSYLIKNIPSSSTSPQGLAMSSADFNQGDYDEYIWDVVAVNGGYTIRDRNGKYINFSGSSVLLGDTAQTINIAKRSDGSFSISKNGQYFNDYSNSHTNAAGYSSDNTSCYLYRGTEGIEITTLTTGTAKLTMNGINYTITVGDVSVEELQEDITRAESTYAEADYLVREWRVYQAALAEAKECVNNYEGLLQPEITAVREKLANAIAGLVREPVYTEPSVTQMAEEAPYGTTQGQPFATGTAGSGNFRIPSLITLSDGTIIAAADARWNWTRDAKSIDIIMSKSKDGGETWEYTFPIFFNDSTNAAHDYGACFIDPLMVRDKNDKIYLMVDLYPGGIAINSAPATPHAATGFVDIKGEKRLVLYITDDASKQNDTNYSYYVGDYIKEGEKALAPIYEVWGENEYSNTASYYIDDYYYLYTADKEPMYCLQLGDETKKVQQNVFFHNSVLHVRCATYLYLVTSEDKGETWSAPMLLNSQVRKEINPDIFYGVGPGAGLWIDDGTEYGTVMLPAYTYSNQIASFIYSTDGGKTWTRSDNATTSSWSSESCLVQLDDATVRHFFRSGTNVLQYTDHTLVNGKWIAGNVVTMDNVVRKQNNQVSAIRYSKTIDGKPAIIFSTATSGGTWDRFNGKIYVLTVDMETEGKPMSLVATYDFDPTTESDFYQYSSMVELEDGSIGLLYECAAAEIVYKKIPMSELAPEIEFDSVIEKVEYTITFKNDDSIYVQQVVESGSSAVVPEQPKKTEHKFLGWYQVVDGVVSETAYDFESPVTEEIILQAKWLELGDIESGDEGDVTEIKEKIWVAGIENVYYNGEKQTFDLRVYDGNKMLTLGKDYTVSYKNNQNAYEFEDADMEAYKEAYAADSKVKGYGTFEAKKAPQVVIKMKGNYKGTHTVYFKIYKKDISLDEFAAADILVTNTENVQKAKPVLTFNGKALKVGRDFEFTASGELKAAGEYTLTLTGKGNFEGTRTVNFTITESKYKVTMDKVAVSGVKNQTYTGEEITLTGVKVKYKGKDLIVNEEYTVSYENNKAAGTASLILTGTGVDGNWDEYSFVGTKVVTFKINGTDMKKVTITGIDKSYDYAYGVQIVPKYKLSFNGTDLTEKNHYEVSLDKNTEKGTAVVTFTGKAEKGYTGSKVVKFKINAKSLEKATVTLKEEGSVAIVKGGSTPKVEVTSEGKTLVEGVDYTVSYQNNKKVAAADAKKAPTVVVTGKGNYTGKNADLKFVIVEKALTNDNGIVVEVKDKETEGKAGDWKQTFKVYDVDGKALSNKTDYNKTATYWVENEDGEMVEATDSNVKVGDIIEVRVTGLGSYGAQVEGQEVYATGTYRLINKGYDISKATIKIKDQYYTGKAIEITEDSQFIDKKAFLKVNGVVVPLSLDKTNGNIEVVDYEKNDVKGTAKVTFEGKGDFGGTKTVTFKIKERDAAANWWDDFTASLQGLFEF